jgi:hypothetical protein
MLHKRVLTVQRVAFGSVVRLVAIGMLGSVVPFFVVMGVFAGFGYSTLTWNGAHVFGLKAVVMAPFMGLFAAVLFTLFAALGIGFGLWLYSLFKPIRLSVWEEDGGTAASEAAAGGVQGLS